MAFRTEWLARSFRFRSPVPGSVSRIVNSRSSGVLGRACSVKIVGDLVTRINPSAPHFASQEFQTLRPSLRLSPILSTFAHRVHIRPNRTCRAAD